MLPNSVQKQIERSSVDVVGPSQHRALNHVDLETNTSESALDFFDTLFGLARDAENHWKMKDLILVESFDHKDVGGARETRLHHDRNARMDARV